MSNMSGFLFFVFMFKLGKLQSPVDVPVMWNLGGGGVGCGSIQCESQCLSPDSHLPHFVSRELASMQRNHRSARHQEISKTNFLFCHLYGSCSIVVDNV